MGVWALRRWDLGAVGRKQANDIVGYFDQLFRDISNDRGGTLAAYAVARLQSFNCDVQNWDLLQSFLFQILVAEPSCARQVVEHFAVQKLKGMLVDETLLRRRPKRLRFAMRLWGMDRKLPAEPAQLELRAS